MQNQIMITEPTKEATRLTKPLSLRFHNWTADKIRRAYSRGDITRRDLLDEITSSRIYYEEPASEKVIATKLRELLSELHVTGKRPAEMAHSVTRFSQRLAEKKVTIAQIDWAFNEWVMSGEKFAPTAGQVWMIIESGGFSVPSKARAKNYEYDLRDICDPSFVRPKQKTFVGAKSKAKEFKHSLTVDERKAVVERVEARKGKFAAKPRKAHTGPQESYAERIKRQKTPRNRIRIGEVKTGAKNFYSLEERGQDQDGKPSWFTIATFIKSSEAQAVIDEAFGFSNQESEAA